MKKRCNHQALQYTNCMTQTLWISMNQYAASRFITNICCPIFLTSNAERPCTKRSLISTSTPISCAKKCNQSLDGRWWYYGIMLQYFNPAPTCHVPIRAKKCPVQASWSHVVSGTRFWLISSESSTANRPDVSCRSSFRFFSVCSMLRWCLPMINVFLMESCTFHPLSEYVGCHRPRRQWAFRLPRSGNLLQQYRDMSDTWWVSTPVIDLYFKVWKST